MKNYNFKQLLGKPQNSDIIYLEIFFTFLMMLQFIFRSFFLILIFTAIGAAQEKCVLSAENAPPLFNLKLGNSPEQVRNILDRKFKIKNKTKGEYTFFQNYIKDAPPNFLTEIRAFYLRFFDGKLYQIEFFYEKQNRFATLEDFVRFQTSDLNLPPSFWKTEYGVAAFDCGGFTIKATNFLNPRIEITDVILRNAVLEKREEED